QINLRAPSFDGRAAIARMDELSSPAAVIEIANAVPVGGEICHLGCARCSYPLLSALSLSPRSMSSPQLPQGNRLLQERSTRPSLSIVPNGRNRDLPGKALFW